MKRKFYSNMSGKHITCSVCFHDDEDSELDKYIENLPLSEQAGIIHRLDSLANDCLPLRKEQYHGFSQFNNPDVFEVKYKRHRLCQVFDSIPDVPFKLIVYVYCFTKTGQKLTESQLNRIDNLRKKYWKNRDKIINDEDSLRECFK